MNIIKLLIICGLVFLALSACGEFPMEQSNISTSIKQEFANRAESRHSLGRWYTSEQVFYGTEVFLRNCAECHGAEAEGTAEDWRKRLDDGSFPPPPLNGSAHAWHHPVSMLLQVINNGGEAYGGKMPSFETVLEEPEKLAAIAFFQSFWTDQIYAQWEKMGGTN